MIYRKENLGMRWNWQQDDWPYFTFDDKEILSYEKEFLYKAGLFLGTYKHLTATDQSQLIIDIMTTEALKTSEIEGEFLNRVSLQSSLRRQFGLQTDACKIGVAEQGIAEMMTDMYQTFSHVLTQDVLFSWHRMLTYGRQDLSNIGSYRTHIEPMQVVSGSIHNPKVHFEAPPSDRLSQDMTRFMNWFNQTSPQSSFPLSPLIRSGIAHLYFVSIHPFEDGNGRIGRALAEKALAQDLNQPSLIALATTIEKNKKAYYDALEFSNKDNHITDWLIYFAQMVLQAQQHSQHLVEFLIQKTKFYDRYKHVLNERQAKVIARMFQEGKEGFKGGLSAENYLRITKTSRATATRDLQDLTVQGVLTKTGELKYSRYFLNLDALSVLS